MSDHSKYVKNPRGELVEIGNVDPNDRYALGPYECIGCRHSMVPALGKIRAHHFKHKGGRPRTCADETYLHNIAKLTLYETITEALRLQKPYMITFSPTLICDRYWDEFRIKCTDQSTQKTWDIRERFDTIELEKGTNGFIADVLLSSTISDQKMLLEIAVTHSCDQNKIDSGLKIIEITVSEESDVDTLRQGIKLSASNVRTYNVKDPKPVPGLCKEPCNKQVRIFCVYKNGKAWYTENTLDNISNHKLDSSVVHYEIHDPKENKRVGDVFRFFFKFMVRAKFEYGVELKSCLLCRHNGGPRTENDIMCLKKDHLQWISSGATYCATYEPANSKAEAERLFNKTLY